MCVCVYACTRACASLSLSVPCYTFSYTGDKRGKYEAPIVGYAGFVPRIGPTQAGLGKPYAGQAQLGLNKFGREQTRQVGPQKELRPSQMGDVPLPGGGSSRNNKDR